jgi:23S rRNA pseudouridine1911/1915/1917 synthase
LSSSEPSEEIWRWFVEKEDAGVRLDHFLADQEIGLTRSRIKKIIDAGLATMAGEVARPAQKLAVGQEIVLRVPPPEPLSAAPEKMELDIRFEDEAVIVVNKPQGLVVHPAPGHPCGTLVNGILYGRTTRGGDPLRPGIVHRLDKDTSGLMVIAKTEAAHASLARQFHEHSVEREYQVLVVGSPPDRGEWDTLHGRNPRDRKLFSSRVERGKRATSRFVTEERLVGAAMLAVSLATGRTHQVRVHCHDHGFPVIGDPQYGPKKLPARLRRIHEDLPGQALHARVLGFVHPLSGRSQRHEAQPPTTFLQALHALRTE